MPVSMANPDSQAVMAQLVAGSAEQGLKPALLLKDGSQLSITRASIDEENYPAILVCRLADGQTLYIHYAEIAGFMENGEDFDL